jgi:hypothetical protein
VSTNKVLALVCVTFAAGLGGGASSSTGPSGDRSSRATVKVWTRLPLVSPNGASAGSLIVREPTHQERNASGFQDTDVVFEVTGERGWSRADLRGGRCRAVDATRAAHESKGAATDLYWAQLKTSSWAVDVYVTWRAKSPAWCAEHAGSTRYADLYGSIDNARTLRKRGRAWVTDLVSYQHLVVGTATLTPKGRGFDIHIKEREFRGDLGEQIDPYAHIRAGTCERVRAGREIFLDVLTDIDPFSYLTQHVNLPLRTILARPHVVEIHSDFWGGGVHSCGELSR